jgi:hypothetical protein
LSSFHRSLAVWPLVRLLVFVQLHRLFFAPQLPHASEASPKKAKNIHRPETRKTDKTEGAVKRAVKKAGPSRKYVDKALGR